MGTNVNSNNETNVLYVNFDDEKAGKTTINTSSNFFAKQNNLVPIEPCSCKNQG